MTIPPLNGAGSGVPPLRSHPLTAPVLTGIPLVNADDAIALPQGAPSPSASNTSRREDAPIWLAGRLELGDVLPETTPLAVALESATRALQQGRPDQVLSALDTVWSDQLLTDSPWYLRTAALELLGRTGDAEQVLRDAIARLPRSAAMLYLLGIHTLQRGQPDAARLANDHALALHPLEPLLWLQRAALAAGRQLPEATSGILQHVESLDPGYPAEQWLATLSQLGPTRGRSATPGASRVIGLLVAESEAAVAEPVGASDERTPPLATSVLESALRFGLTLLDSPVQSARNATTAAAALEAARDAGDEYAAMLTAKSSAPAAPSPAIAWDTVTLLTSVLVLAVVPPLRLPALMLAGAAAMLIVSRRLG
jgi:hypothetical protein